MTTTSIRQADLNQLAAALHDQKTRSLDVVAPASQLTFTGGSLVLQGVEPILDETGFTIVDGTYQPTGVGDEGIADKLDIPLPYLRRMRTGRLDLFDANVNGWLANDKRSFLLRLLRGDQASESRGVLRAFLSDKYRTIDNFDVLLATLAGMKEAGVESPEIQADLTDRRMIVRVTVPSMKVYAPELLKGYRSPFDGRPVGRGWTPEAMAQHNNSIAHRATLPDDPIVFAGFVIANSETGNGRYSITPRLEIKVCANGLTISADALSQVHLGAKQDSGIVKASGATVKANIELVKQQTADAVRTFLDVDYVKAKVAEMEEAAGVKVADAQAVVATVGKQLGFTKEQQADILGHFIQGGQLTAGGIMQAVTSAAQLQVDGDAQHEMELAALPALKAAAALASRK
jgi:hypothetical protein